MIQINSIKLYVLILLILFLLTIMLTAMNYSQADSFNELVIVLIQAIENYEDIGQQLFIDPWQVWSKYGSSTDYNMDIEWLYIYQT